MTAGELAAEPDDPYAQNTAARLVRAQLRRADQTPAGRVTLTSNAGHRYANAHIDGLDSISIDFTTDDPAGDPDVLITCLSFHEIASVELPPAFS